MSNAPFYSNAMRWGVKAGPGVLLADGLARGRVTAGGQNHPVPGGMLETAENLRREYEIPREEQDEYAVRSHQRAAAAVEAGRFAEEIVPVTVKQRTGEVVVDRDEHIRPDSSVETLARLRPIMGDPGVGLHRRRLRADQRQRLGHLAGPPGGRHRRPHPGHPDPRDGRRDARYGAGDDVRRRRSGPRRPVRAGPS